MGLGSISSKITTFIHQQNQEIQTLIDEIRRKFEESNRQIQSSSSSSSS